MTFHVIFLVLAVKDEQVFGVDVRDRDSNRIKERLGRRIFFQEVVVGQDGDIIERETGRRVAAILFWRTILRIDFEPCGLLAGFHFGDRPVWCPCIEKYRFSAFEARYCVCDNSRIFTLVMVHGIAQFQCIEFVIDDQLGTPAGIGAGKICLAVSIGVEKLGNLGIFELRQGRDFMGVSSLLVDKIALGRASYRWSETCGSILDRLEESIMQWYPVVDSITAVAA